MISVLKRHGKSVSFEWLCPVLHRFYGRPKDMKATEGGSSEMNAPSTLSRSGSHVPTLDPLTRNDLHIVIGDLMRLAAYVYLWPDCGKDWPARGWLVACKSDWI